MSLARTLTFFGSSLKYKKESNLHLGPRRTFDDSNVPQHVLQHTGTLLWLVMVKIKLWALPHEVEKESKWTLKKKWIWEISMKRPELWQFNAAHNIIFRNILVSIKPPQFSASDGRAPWGQQLPFSFYATRLPSWIALTSSLVPFPGLCKD